MNATLPPGKYYIGDPCYPFDKSWNDVLTETDFFEKDVQTIRGIPVFGASTAFGDGRYDGSNGFEYGVDAGLLGAIPVELIERDCEGLGTIVDAPNGLVCSCHNGVFNFKIVGGELITIDTLDSPDEDEDEDDDFSHTDEDDE